MGDISFSLKNISSLGHFRPPGLSRRINTKTKLQVSQYYHNIALEREEKKSEMEMEL